MEDTKELITTDDIRSKVYIIRGQQVMLDKDLAEIYGYEVNVVDDYMNAKSLQHLSQKADGVEVVLFTENGKGGRGFLTNSLVTDFQNEYPTIRIKPNPDCHDRLIILDYGEKTELVYHCGASSKDAGKKLCAIMMIVTILSLFVALYSIKNGDVINEIKNLIEWIKTLIS